MAPGQQTKTFTVPVGTRLSHGVELEMLVAYLHTSEVDPDEANSESLPPILRVDAAGDADDPFTSMETAEDIIIEDIRTTLRNHGIGVGYQASISASEGVPGHLAGTDKWDVTTDVSVSAEREEIELVRGKPGRYRWLGVELRSPACWDEPRAYDELRFVINLMKSKYRVRLNPSCGLHVHVAAGPRFFDAKTLRRAGAFFFAADPMLSRLHAPWRRVGLYTPSIRYVSRLALLDETKPLHAQITRGSAAQLFRGERPPFADSREYLPIVPWSDRSMEETDFGGKENWERYANERVRDGPHITLVERPPTPESRKAGKYPVPKPPASTTPAPAPAPAPLASSLLPSSLLLSSNGSDHGGGAHYRQLLRLMETSEFRAACLQHYNHEFPEELSSEELYTLLIINRCEHLFGHTSVNLLTDSQYYQLTVACEPYIEIARSSWEWDANRNEFTLKDAPMGTILRHPKPRTLRQINGREVVKNLQAQADALAAEGEQRALQGDLLGVPDDGDDNDSITYDRDQFRRNYYDLIDRLMEQPTFPLDNVEGLLNRLPDSVTSAATDSNFNPPTSEAVGGNTGTAPGAPSSEPSGSSNNSSAEGSGNNGGNSGNGSNGFGVGFQFPQATASGAFGSNSTTQDTSDDSSNSEGDFNPPAFAALLEPFPVFDPTVQDDSDGTSSSEGDFNPPAFAALMERLPGEAVNAKPSYQASSSPFLSNVSPASQSNNNKNKIVDGPRLYPHDVFDLPGPYIFGIARRFGLEGGDIRRIPWLPYRGGPPDPAEMHAPGSETCRGPDCRQHVRTDTRTGLATILSMDSAAAVAELLVSNKPAERANYNFANYELISLTIPGKRTLEFREAGGSLDASWIITWAKICTGIVRFCRDASVVDFLTVLDRVVREEERQRTVNPQSEDPEMYDVCDLLEDMCLWAEASTIRRREEKLGPPR